MLKFEKQKGQLCYIAAIFKIGCSFFTNSSLAVLKEIGFAVLWTYLLKKLIS